MRFFISGLPASGKSTLVSKVIDFLRKNDIRIGGIVTPEVRDRGRRIGFKVVDLMTLKESIFASINYKSNHRVGKYFVDVDLFENIAIPALEKAETESDIVVIDEIGKMELFSKKFEETVKRVLNGSKPILAVVHRNYLEEYKRYGKIYWLEREKWDDVFKLIFSEVQKIFKLDD